MRFRTLHIVPLFVSFAVPWAVSCSSSDRPEGTGGGSTGATGGAAPTGGMPATSGGAPTGSGGRASSAGGMATATGGMATSGGTGGGTGGIATAGGTGGAAAGGGGLGGNNVAGDAGMGGEGGFDETGGTAGSGTAGSGTAGSGTAGSGMGGASSGAFSLTIAGFTPMAGCTTDTRDSCAVWPRPLQQYMTGDNISPAMTWTGAPAGTQSFAVVLLDESLSTNVHWAIWNIPASVMMLPADIPKTSAMPATPAGSQQANLSTGDGYFGPGSECNVYSFTLYALAVPTFTPAMNTAASVRTGILALGDQLLGQVAVFGRQDFNGTCNP